MHKRDNNVVSTAHVCFWIDLRPNYNVQFIYNMTYIINKDFHSTKRHRHIFTYPDRKYSYLKNSLSIFVIVLGLKILKISVRLIMRLINCYCNFKKRIKHKQNYLQCQHHFWAFYETFKVINTNVVFGFCTWSELLFHFTFSMF